MKNFDTQFKKPITAGGAFDPASIEERIKNLKFAKVNSLNGTKDSSWFSKIDQPKSDEPE